MHNGQPAPNASINRIAARARRFPSLWAFLGYLVLVSLFFAPVLLGRRTLLPGDFTEHFLPFSLFQRSELLAGRLPLWNPYTYAGHPFLADIQAAVFYPISNLVLALTLPVSSAAGRLYALQLEALLQVALAGFFTYLLVRDLTGRPTAAFLAGCVFAFSGYLTGYPVLQLAVLRTGIWLPLVLWLLLRAFGTVIASAPCPAGHAPDNAHQLCHSERVEHPANTRLRLQRRVSAAEFIGSASEAIPGSWLWWVLAAIAYAVAFLAGHPQTFLHLSYVVVAWIALLLVLARPGRSGRPRLASYLARIGVFYALFLSLSAAQLLPTLEFTRLSVRASADYAFVSGGFPLVDTWQFLMPGLLSFFSPLYVGIAALGLALLTVVQAAAPAGQARPARLVVAFFALLALLALLTSYGRNGFLFAVVYRLLPGWKLFQSQERLAYLVAFALSVLAGFGAAWVDQLSTRRRRAVALAYAILALAGLAVFVSQGRRWDDPLVQETLLASLVSLMFFVLILWPNLPPRPPSLRGKGEREGVSVDASPVPLPSEGRGQGRGLLLLALVLADLFWANAGTIVDQADLQAKAALPPEAQAVQAAVAAAPTANLGIPGRVFNEYRAFDDYGMLAGAEDLWGSSPLRLQRYADLREKVSQERLWQLTGVQHVLTWMADLGQPAARLGEFAGKDGPTYLYRLDQLRPRAWLVDNVQTVDDGLALARLSDGNFDPGTVALLPPLIDAQGRGRPAWTISHGMLAAPGASTVQLQQKAPGRMEAQVQSDHGGLLVVAENWMPGWRAAVRQGGAAKPRPIPVLRADLTLLAVPVDPGASTIELAYRPASVQVGLAVSLVTVVLLLAAVLWRRRARGARTAGHGNRLPAQAWLGARWPMAGVLLLAFGLRVFRLGFQELRGDEAFGYFFSLNPVAAIIRDTIRLREPHPVASYLVQQAWLAVAGHTEFALRFTTVWFGVLAVALLYRLGRRLRLGSLAAALGAGLLAISPYAIWHSQDARMYSMSLALTTASTWLALEALDRQRAWSSRRGAVPSPGSPNERSAAHWRSSLLRPAGYWLAYILVSWLALHTHYFAIFVVVAQNAFVLLLALFDKPARRQAPSWLLAQAMLALLYLPWLVAAFDTIARYHGNVESPGWLPMVQRSLSVFAAGESAPVEQRTLLAVLSGLLLLIAAARLWVAGPQARRALLLLVLYLFVPLLATWISALRRPIFSERYLIAAAPPFFLLLAVAVLGLTSQATARAPSQTAQRRIDALAWPAAALLGLLLVGSLASLSRHYTDPLYSKTRGWRELAATLQHYAAALPPEQVRLAQNFPDPTLWYYYTGPALRGVLPPAPNNEDRTRSEVGSWIDQGAQRVILPVERADWWDATGVAERVLRERFALVATTPVEGWSVQVYERPASLAPVGADFANGLRLAAAGVNAATLVPGDALTVNLRWEGDPSSLQGSEKLSLQLLGSDGRLLTQTDRPFAASALETTTTETIDIPWRLPAGDYRLIAALYDPGQPGAPRLLTAEGADHVDFAVLSAPGSSGAP